MGRELRRVPLDFDWRWQDGGETWPGFLFHHSDDCEDDWTEEKGYVCGKAYHKHVDPPAGDGFQLWQTTSEGSPISPVFPTLRELAEWAAENATTFGHHRTSADNWERMLSDGLVITPIGPGMIAL